MSTNNILVLINSDKNITKDTVFDIIKIKINNINKESINNLITKIYNTIDHFKSILTMGCPIARGMTLDDIKKKINNDFIDISITLNKSSKSLFDTSKIEFINNNSKTLFSNIYCLNNDELIKDNNYILDSENKDKIIEIIFDNNITYLFNNFIKINKQSGGGKRYLINYNY